MAKGHAGEGFFIKELDGLMVRLSHLSPQSDARELVAASSDGSQRVRLSVTQGSRHIALFRIQSAEGIAPERFESLHFSALSNSQLRVLSLDSSVRRILGHLSDGSAGFERGRLGAATAFAWAWNDDGEIRYTAVLKVPPISSP